MGRAWLADPKWGEKAKAGATGEIRKCIGCMYCFQTLMERIPQCGAPQCAINPRAFNEVALPLPKIDEQHHHVVVIGGGPAGLCAALTAAEREMRVTLIEKNDRLGGLVNYASASPVKGDMHWVIDWYENQIMKKGVNVMLSTEASVGLLKQLAPDAIIVATGAEIFVPDNIPGVDMEHVYDIYDILGGTSGLKDKSVAIIGAGITGLECGEYLNETGCRTTIIDMTPSPAPNDFQGIVMDDCGRLAQAGTQFIMNHALKEIRKDCVVISDIRDNTETTVPCHTVVLSLGLKSNDAIVSQLEENFDRVAVVGGAKEVAGKIGGAVNSAYQCVLNLFSE